MITVNVRVFNMKGIVNNSHCYFTGFGLVFSFLVKITCVGQVSARSVYLLTIFFREIAMFSSKTLSFNIILLNSADKVANLVGYSKKHIPYVPIPSIKNLDYFSVNISIRSGHVYGMKFCKIQLCHE